MACYWLGITQDDRSLGHREMWLTRPVPSSLSTRRKGRLAVPDRWAEAGVSGGVSPHKRRIETLFLPYRAVCKGLNHSYSYASIRSTYSTSHHSRLPLHSFIIEFFVSLPKHISTNHDTVDRHLSRLHSTSSCEPLPSNVSDQERVFALLNQIQIIALRCKTTRTRISIPIQAIFFV